MQNSGIINRVIKHYRIERLIGQGGMAAVYEALDLDKNRKVAIKLMHSYLSSQKVFRERFLQEAEVLAQMEHPNIICIYDWGDWSGELFIAMEYIAGGNLRKYIKDLHERNLFLNYAEAIEIIKQTAEGLNFAHKQGKVHRDIKPDNILLRSESNNDAVINYRPIIADFGLAKLTDADQEAATDQEPIGTYPYMSPEQCDGVNVDQRSDLYSLGIMLYELVVGHLPFNPKTIGEAARMHGSEPLPLPSSVRRNFPQDLEQVVVKSLEKKPEKRYQTAAQIIDDLSKIQQKIKRVPRAKPVIEQVIEGTNTDIKTVPSQVPLEIAPIYEIPDISQEDQEEDHIIVIPSGDEKIYTVKLAKAVTTIGRYPEHEISISHLSVSRRHGKIERKPNGKYYLIDTGSTNGIWLDGERLQVNVPAILNPTSVAKIGDYWIQLLPGILKREIPVDEEIDGTGVVAEGAVAAAIGVADDYSTDADALVEGTAAGEAAGTPGAVTGEAKPAASAGTSASGGKSTTSSTGAAKSTTAAAEKDGIDTGIMPIIPFTERPAYNPPPLNSYQMNNDRLVFYGKEQPVLVISLDRNEFVIGRSKDSDIHIDDPRMSLQHAKVNSRSDGSFWITDLGSANGVWMEHERLSPNNPARLAPNKVMRIGPTWVIFEQKNELALLPTDAKPEEQEDASDVMQDTVGMVRPLPMEMPPHSQPILTPELRNSDRLFFYSEDHPIQMVKLEKDTMYIGRGKDQDIILQGKRVSRRHMLLKVKTDGKIYITDLSSKNGVWIDDILLVPDTEVVWLPRETIRLGNYWLKFERGAGAGDYGQLRAQDNYGRVGKVFGEYRVDMAMGVNPVTAVYKGTEIRSGKEVAIKFLNPQYAIEQTLKQRFLEEARVLSRLNHPNIVHVITHNTMSNEVFMVMDLVKGGRLRDRLNEISDRGRNMEYEEMFDLAIQICEGLHYAHQQGMIYRDLSPRNVVLKVAERVGPIAKYVPILTDFTLQRFADSSEIFEDEQDALALYPYMSPEQCRKDKIDIRSDIYEMGVILYEMLVGRPPYQPKSIAEAVRMHAREPVPKMAEMGRQVPDELEKIILKCLDKDPNNRFQTAGDIVRTLQKVTVDLAASMPSLQSYVSGSGISALGSSGNDPFATRVMVQPLPRQMPLMTPPPRIVDEDNADRLIFYSEKHPTRVLPVRKGVITIGRGEDQDIQLESDTVSRRHVRLERGIDGFYRITDTGSKNGSWLGNYKLLKNVTEMWESIQTVRIGDYWVRIERAEDVRAELASRRSSAMDDEEYKTDPFGKDKSPNGAAQAAPAIQHPSPPHDKIGVKVTETILQIKPGATGTMALEIINQSDLVDHFKIEVVGLPAAWFTAPSEPLYLLPRNRETTSITFHPPLSSTSSAGAHAFEVRVSTRAQGISAVRTQGSLIIEPYHAYTVDLYPDKIKRRGVLDLTITNTGNTHGTYTIQARDREQIVKVDLNGKQYKLPPGHSEQILLRVAPSRRHWFGKPQMYPFEVMVTPTPLESAGGPQTRTAELTVYARIARWMLIMLVLLLILLVIAAVLVGLEARRVFTESQTATAVIDVTHAVATQTAIALSDPDQDGINNIREATLATFPDLADTDEDGVNDGDEIRVWLTNPLNRDTDGDTLSDGDEVKAGYDPLKRDTDDDGVPDNEDPFPSLRSTPTPTAFPTVPGTLGDICPGSPIPSRLTVGISAKVESGGVDNRIRAEPGLDAEIIGFMPPGSAFLITGGPVCDEEKQIRWWEIQFGDEKGWTAEGEGEEYYLCPPDACEGEEETDEESSQNITPPDNVVVSLDRSRMGIQLYTNTSSDGWNTTVSYAETLEFGWVKMQADWRFLQPDGPTYTARLDEFLQRVRDASNRGYKVLVSVTKAPDWARTARENDGPPDDPEVLADFIALMLDNAGSNINAIEVWNEPNLRREWTGKLSFSGEGYMKLFTAAYERIRQYSADIVVVTAGLAPTGKSSQSINDRRFLRQMYEAVDIVPYDKIAIGIHPYSWGNSPDTVCCDVVDGRGWDDQPQFFFLNNLESYHNIMLDYGHRRARLWVTEFGWTTWHDLGTTPPESWMNYISPQDQASYTIRAFEIGQSLDYVGPMFLWNFNFANPSTIAANNEIAGYSMVIMDTNNNLHARPLYEALVHNKK